MDIRFNCPHCNQHLAVDESGAGMTVNCPSCKEQIEIPTDSTKSIAPPSVPPPARAPALSSQPPPIPQSPVNASIEKASSFAGVGCLLQGIGAVCFVLAILTFKISILPIVFGILGLWLLFYGSRKASWYRCSVCGGKLSHSRVSVCPHCNARFRK
jgi:phage FluMu protein Com